MCLLSLVSRFIPDCPLLLIANRDERRDRPSGSPQIVAGQKHSWLGGIDLERGGTWLGVNDAGLLVAVTNRPKFETSAKPRPCGMQPGEMRSRGLLCRDLLERSSVETALQETLQQLDTEIFDGCNVLLAGTEQAMMIEAGDDIRTIPLQPGIHTLANGSLDDSHNPRVERFARHLRQFSTSGPRLEEWLIEARRLCGLPSENDQPALCLTENSSWGTVSATIIALTANPTHSRYLYADGPPHNTPFRDESVLLQQLLAADGAGATVSPPHRISRHRLSPHRISLRSPWQYEWLSPPRAEPSQPVSGRTPIPVTWEDMFGSTAGTVRFRRRFHRPTNLEPHEQVQILFENLGGSATVSLNGTPLGTSSREHAFASFSITDRLQPSNELTVDLTYDPQHDSPSRIGILAPVVIEIRPTAKQTLP